MYLPEFKYYKPSSLHEAMRILINNKNAVILSGGTDVLVEIKNGIRDAPVMLSLARIPDLKGIIETDDSIIIGAVATYNEIAKSQIINNYLPALREAVLKIGSEQVRNIGTIGGNLCTGASCADTIPILTAYEAVLELESSIGIRKIPVKDFLFFHHRTAIAQNEILTKIIIPKPSAETGACFEKFGLREASSISVASSAAVMRFEGDICSSALIVIGACSPVPKIIPNAALTIIGHSKHELLNFTELAEQAGKRASEDSLPIDDIRGSAEYRRHLVTVLTKKAIIAAVERSNMILN